MSEASSRHRTARAALVALAGVFAVAACSDGTRAPSGSPSEPRLGRRADAIQGGSVDAASTFAVAVVDEDDGVCSGTLIAPNLVLTARHCVASDDGGDTVDCANDHFLAPRPAAALRVSTSTSNVTFAGAAFHVGKIVVPADTLFCGNDLALLVLDSLVPASVATPATPAIDPKLTDRKTFGAELTAIGYGITSPVASDEGTRRKRTGVPIACIPGDAAACDPADYDMTNSELAAGEGLCDGDSGSGAYEPKSLAAGEPIVMGVLSRAGDDAGKCVDAIYVRTDTASALLVSAAKDAAKTGGYPAPSWADPTGTAKPDAGETDAGAASSDAGGEGVDMEATADGGPSTTSDPTSDGCSVARGLPRTNASRDGLATSALVAMTVLVTSRRRRRRSHRR